LLRVASVSAGLNVELLTEVKFDQLRDLYLRAFAYVHASGYGRDPEAEPQLFEHFGMAVAQAIGAGCIPIVFNAAGPKEIVEGLGIGVTFESIGDLVAQLASVLSSFPTESVNERCLTRAQAAEARFSPVVQRYQVDAAIARFRSESQDESHSVIELTA
jgi:glycosyltransferase involved in cell wall biosynthesis